MSALCSHIYSLCNVFWCSWLGEPHKDILLCWLWVGRTELPFFIPLSFFCIKQIPFVVLLIKPIFWHLKSWHVLLESGNEIHTVGGEEERPGRSTPCCKSNPSATQRTISADFDFLSASHQPLFLTKSSYRTCVFHFCCNLLVSSRKTSRLCHRLSSFDLTVFLLVALTFLKCANLIRCSII